MVEAGSPFLGTLRREDPAGGCSRDCFLGTVSSEFRTNAGNLETPEQWREVHAQPVSLPQATGRLLH